VLSGGESHAQHYNVTDVFDEVVTNPAQFNSNGLLELRRRVDPNGPQHSCKVGCSPNMCKGARASFFLLPPLVRTPLCRRGLRTEKKTRSFFRSAGEELEAFMQRHGGWDQFDKVVYIGDGGNDLCPILRLRACVSLSLFSPQSSFAPLTICSHRTPYTPQSRRRARPHVPRAVASHRRHLQCARLGPQVPDCLVGRSVGGRKVLQGAALNRNGLEKVRPYRKAI
jgi:hypothetical protein